MVRFSQYFLTALMTLLSIAVSNDSTSSYDQLWGCLKVSLHKYIMQHVQSCCLLYVNTHIVPMKFHKSYPLFYQCTWVDHMLYSEWILLKKYLYSGMNVEKVTSPNNDHNSNRKECSSIYYSMKGLLMSHKC